MNSTDRPSNPDSTSNEITRRSFMKKSALTVGALAILGQGIGLAIGDDGSGSGAYRMKCNAPSADGMTAFTTMVIPIPQRTTPETFVNATIEMEAFTSKGKDPDGDYGGYLTCVYSSGVAINISASTSNYANWTADNTVACWADDGSILATIASNWHNNQFPDLREVKVRAGTQEVSFTFKRIPTGAPIITSGVQLAAINVHTTGDENNTDALIINQSVDCKIDNVFYSYVVRPLQY
jgi:hypothetical protein